MKSIFAAAALLLHLGESVTVSNNSAPLAITKKGTYQGRYIPEWHQDAFLGMPYAQPPVGDLRFRWPRSLNSSFDGVRDASEYGYSCMQYHSAFNISEDCLTLNVIRPAGDNHNTKQQLLPVLVWIYGGGLYAGSTADPQYNLSGIVRVSQDMGQPVIAVDMNYRLGMWGFLQTPALVAEGSSNAGLLDQRLALHWIQENIEAFGGDPDRVVVWGESAGAQSIAYHLFSYDGRDDGLFRGAIMESGGPTGCQVQDLAYYAVPLENLTRTVGCYTADDQLACLRGLDSDTLFAAAPAQVWNPLIDGDFLTGYPSALIRDGKYNAIPLLTGTNTDEGTGFSPSKPNTEADLFYDFLSWRSYGLSPPTIRRLLELYPDDPCTEPPLYISNCSVFPSKGLAWRRGAAIGGDMVIHSGRRKMCETYAGGSAGQAVYSYRFDTRLWNQTALYGIHHFDNVAFSFQNISGLLGASPAYDDDMRIARSVGVAYVSFVNRLDPNPLESWGLDGDDGDGGKSGNSGKKVDRMPLPEWPRYSLEKPTNMVFNVTGPWVEEDTWRKEGIA
ncbi:hypothetical protein VMCG_06619 [Cytospora schulzeri]|uniref:Carboxylic ester hydrolase n=1 Tax=Cytospora schulzeri TaxID=448051 RepID=A0A423W6R6_9PEZI|nr:hypothetical protein VMCG_06619 [Valsa malicola]